MKLVPLLILGTFDPLTLEESANDANGNRNAGMSIGAQTNEMNRVKKLSLLEGST